eukprot:CAMPEP_0174292692 /NCGR_PEP_ID=MMETSP0809-20121228/36255_1 /TAXON_ID=73025 ORGANISM="Eutreptiella gymnastica-like, Strain CCMP1594" /NCGR_SAMPLE_ID=MMETSP0809 /ASSEMBLY_ACC=CAM_ASM_000658 /LENGTH=153 /DNA_ID=CAMNT_0015392927 /DNA_START=27 /DNA_END=487 /DNA_ORIENTATION=-
MTHGESFRANVNTAWDIFSDSPCHFDSMLAGDNAKNIAAASVAMALAKRVLPVPGGAEEQEPRRFRVQNPRFEELGVGQGHQDALLHHLFGLVQAADRIEAHVDIFRKHHLLQQPLLVLIGQFNGRHFVASFTGCFGALGAFVFTQHLQSGGV